MMKVPKRLFPSLIYSASISVILSLSLLQGCGNQQPTSTSNLTRDTAKRQAELSSGITLENFDTSVRPQDDFFRYVNGTWLKTTAIPADKSRYGAFVILADKARDDMREIILESANKTESKPGSEAQKVGDLYESFMDTAKLEALKLKPLAAEFAKIDALENKDQLAGYFAEATRIGSNAPFAFYVDVDAKNTDEYITTFVHVGLGLPDRDFYFKKDEKSTEIRQKYLAHIEKMLMLAGLPSPTRSARNILELETRIADAHWTRVERRDRDKTYNKYSLATLEPLASGFPWKTYIDSANLGKEKDFIIQTPSFYQKFDKIFQEVPLANWKAYQKWHLLNSFADKLSSDFDSEHFAFYGKTLQGIETQEERWKRGVSTVNDALGEMVGKVYVEKHFRPQAKERMEQLVENLRDAYRESIKGLDWMGEETKQEALEKLGKFNPKIGYPDKWRDYSALAIDSDELIGNFIRTNKFLYDIQIDKLGKPVDRDEWFMTPQTVNAYYNPDLNEIVFPAAILQPPFFNMEADDAVNYGAIGAVIGHEMGHGFDDQGSKSDGDGMLRNWWTEKDLAEFKERTKKLVRQYDKYEALPGEFVNGQLALGENIGDLGGLTIAHKAYQLSLGGKEAPEMDGFTGDQRFFIGWAQVWAYKYREEALRQQITVRPHSPAEFRVNGVVRNMTEFVEAFDVKPEDKLYLPPDERVKIW